MRPDEEERAERALATVKAKSTAASAAPPAHTEAGDQEEARVCASPPAASEIQGSG